MRLVSITLIRGSQLMRSMISILLWADGDTTKPSESSLYFTDREGTAVWKLPARMTADFAKPQKLE